MKLTLKNCADPDAFIEVGLRGVQAKAKGEAKNRESTGVNE
jgi:hypothetical protein